MTTPDPRIDQALHLLAQAQQLLAQIIDDNNNQQRPPCIW